MAKFIPILGQLSGTLSGVVFSHNRNGAYARARALPINPRTNRQSLVRTIFANFANAWSLLTVAQQEGWRDYAQTMPLVDSLGQTYFISGFNAYVRGNAFRLSNLLDGLSAPPVLGGQAAAVVPSVGAIVLSDSTSADPNKIKFDLADIGGFDAALDDTVLQVQLSPLIPTGVLFFSTPFQIKGQVFGDTASPPTFATIGTGLILSVGQRAAVKLRWADDDARVSPAYQEIVTVTNVP